MVNDFDNMDWLEEEPYFEEAVAKAFNGKVILENGTTYVTFGINKLHIVSGDKFKEIICYWKNDVNGKISSAFLDGNTPNKLWLAINSAKEVIGMNGENYKNPKLLEKAKSRCTDCHAESTKNGLYWCNEGDCDITAVLNCKEWENEDIGNIV